MGSYSGEQWIALLPFSNRDVCNELKTVTGDSFIPFYPLQSSDYFIHYRFQTISPVTDFHAVLPPSCSEEILTDILTKPTFQRLCQVEFP